jgi:hypothetical protein
MKDETRRHSACWLVSIAASSEAANNLSRSHSMQSACDARLQKDLKLHGVHSRAQNGIEANVLSGDKRRKRATCESELLPDNWCIRFEASMSSRCEGRNADGGEAADSGASRLCTRDGVLSRCTSNLLSPPRFTPLLSASLSLQVGKSKPLQTPAPRHDPHPSHVHGERLHPCRRLPLGGLPFCLLSRSGTKAALSCTVLSDSPVTPLPTNHCSSTAATN